MKTRKTIKIVFAIALVLVLAFVFTGCSGGDDEEDSDNNNSGSSGDAPITNPGGDDNTPVNNPSGNDSTPVNNPHNGSGDAGITLGVSEITEGVPVINANITISRTNNGYPVTSPVSVSNPSEYTNISWAIAGVGAYTGQTVTGSGPSFSLNAADSRYNSPGGHVLILTVTKGGQQYQRAIPFTIVQ